MKEETPLCRSGATEMGGLMLKYLQLKAKRGWSLSTLVALLRWNLFTYRDLWRWIDDPFGVPPERPAVLQMEFTW